MTEAWSRRARHIQLALGLIWLLDGGLQFQSFMYSKGFVQMLVGTSSEQPNWVVASVTWAAHQAGSNLAVFNTVFALVQVLIGLGLIFRPTVRPALAVSVVWSLAVWWFGESFGGMLSSTASPLTGAPGAVLLYGVLALIAWPAGEAGGLLGRRGTLYLWAGLWAWMAYEWLGPMNTQKGMIASMIQAAPSGMSWLTQVQDWARQAATGNGEWIAILLASLSLVIGVGVLLGWRVRELLIVSVVLNLVFWVVGQGLGGIFQGGATDPNAGPLWVLLAYATAGVVALAPARVSRGAVRAGVAMLAALILAGCAAAEKTTTTVASAGSSGMSGMKMGPAPSIGGIRAIPSQVLGTSVWQGMKITAQAMTPVPFIVFDGTSAHEIKPTRKTTFHLMVMLNDAQTHEPIPYATVWATVLKAGHTVFDERQWPMISRYMGPHYGNDVTLPGPGHYTLSLLVSPPVSARHLEYQDVWTSPHRVNMSFTWR